MEKEFIQRWIERLTSKELKNFPDAFINSECSTIELPQKYLVLGPELFGSYELLDTDGKPHYQAPDMTYAKYVLYANRTKPALINMPVSYDKVNETVKEYEKHLDSLVRMIYDDYKSVFPRSNNHVETASQIFSAIDLRRYY